MQNWAVSAIFYIYTVILHLTLSQFSIFCFPVSTVCNLPVFCLKFMKHICFFVKIRKSDSSSHPHLQMITSSPVPSFVILFKFDLKLGNSYPFSLRLLILVIFFCFNSDQAEACQLKRPQIVHQICRSKGVASMFDWRTEIKSSGRELACTTSYCGWLGNHYFDAQIFYRHIIFIWNVSEM